MRLLHLITTLERGGAENHLLQLVSRQVASGISVEVTYLKGSGELGARFQELGVPTRRISSIRELLRLRRLNCDVVHAHLPRAELAGLLVSALRKPLIVSSHNTEPFWPSGPAWASRFLSGLVDRKITRRIAISSAVAAYQVESGHAVRSDRILVVPYGYEVPLGDFSDSVSLPEEPIALGVVARLVAQKDLPTLFAAVAQLRGRGHDVSVKIAGAGPDRNCLMQLSSRLGLAESVSFVGRINNPVEFIAESNIFVLPSKYEGFGLVLLEASAARTPIVAARNTAMAEVVVDNETGLLFETGNPEDLADKIELLIEDPALRERLSEGAYRRLTTVYTPEAMVEKTLEVYREALAEVRE